MNHEIRGSIVVRLPTSLPRNLIQQMEDGVLPPSPCGNLESYHLQKANPPATVGNRKEQWNG